MSRQPASDRRPLGGLIRAGLAAAAILLATQAAAEDIEVVVDRDDSDERKGVYRLKASIRLTG